MANHRFLFSAALGAALLTAAPALAQRGAVPGMTMGPQWTLDQSKVPAAALSAARRELGTEDVGDAIEIIFPDGRRDFRFEIKTPSGVHRTVEVTTDGRVVTSAVAALPKPLSPVEVNRKLPVIDQALAIVRDDMGVTATQGPRLQAGWLAAFTDRGPTNGDTYLHDLIAYRDAFRQNAAKLRALRDTNAAYEDIGFATQQPVYERVSAAIDRFVTAATFAKTSVDPRGDSGGALQFFMTPYNDDFAKAIAEFAQWRTTTVAKLQDLRRQTAR
ncbi:MAG: hypothetical protein JO128_11520 [Alphaproteobacteria bacterium]|nr:hypothetical protein [Alphaproteobacteria bacterium]